ncbi:MAG TPA: cysteine desulfurase [Candidatus Nanoarchaeia archaeon]|nr:cysteine desulfurase [Candidatus Nanoarchaeia archaeon]
MDITNLRKDFPILKRKINGKDLIYLDSAATTQRPSSVIEAIKEFYENNNANINRGIHTLGDEATRMYEETRKKVAAFINANYKEIVFVRNATEAINLVVHAYVKPKLKENDVILLTEMEHHANLVSWQIIAKEKRAKIEYIPITEEGELDIKKAKEMLAKKPRFLALTHISNVLGTINPVKEIIKIAHDNEVEVLIDGAQSVPHMKTDVKDLDCDFLAFSSHKMLGPTGVGILYGKKHLLEKMEPLFGGGDMIKEVHFDHFVADDIPSRFEAGTPNIADVIAFAKAIEYLEKTGMKNVEEHDKEITKYALEKLSKIKNIKVYGPKSGKERGALVAFNSYDNEGRMIHAHDLATIIDEQGICMRAGHHCAMPLHEKLDIPASARISFYIYTTKEEIDMFIQALENVKKIFNKEIEVLE